MDQQGVPSAAVPGNYWPALDVAPAGSFEPELPASVVVAYYEAPEALDLTLAALEGQTYPRHLFEVVVVDDGSDPPLAPPAESPLDVRVLRQEDRGFGLARARNTGARAAAHEILVFLDCDMMPESGWLAAHARWHHAANDALTLGFRSHVDMAGINADSVRERSGSLAELFADRPTERPGWIEFHMTRTRELTSHDDDAFRAVTGGNLGISRAFFEAVGGLDETFTQWGAEDTEFGYRAFTSGGLLVPARDALCWHQGAGASPDEAESESMMLQRAKTSHLVAHRGFRSDSAGRSFTVPQYVVTVEPGDTQAQLTTAETVLAGRVHDLVVWIEEPVQSGANENPAREHLRRLLTGDPRVRFGPIDGAVDAVPAAPFHISIPAGAAVKTSVVEHLRRKLGSATRASLNLADRQTAEIVRARALNRRARSGLSLDDFDQQLRLKPERSRFRRFRKLAEVVARLARDAVRVRSLADARALSAWFVSWVAGAAGWRIRLLARKTRRTLRGLRRRTARRLRRTAKTLRRIVRRRVRAARSSARRKPARSDGKPEPAAYRLGPEMATLGPLSGAVLAASGRVGNVIGPDTEAAIVDTPHHAHDIGANATRAVVVLSEIDPRASVPAFDAESVNPVGWTLDHRGHTLALGPSEHLPESKRTQRTASPHGRTACRHAHHVVDTAAYHSDATARAGALVALAASGAVVHIADHSGELHHRLGAELYFLMADERIVTADAHEREAFSVAMRRSALRDHSLRARTRQVLAGTDLGGPPLPLVSILLATRRPDLLTAAIGAVRAQSYPRIELVLAPHGDGFDRGTIDGLLHDLDHPARVAPADGQLPLGAVLNAAAAESTGTLLTKFDDDDLYGPEHLWDLVLAHEYSRAPLVGKGAEYVHLEGADRTLHRFRGGGERYVTTQSIAGGAMMITRHCFDSVLGWQNIPHSVDKALITDVVAAGHKAYRTHGMGYMLVRHGEGHTWQADDAYFRKQAAEVREGCDLAFAGIA